MASLYRNTTNTMNTTQHKHANPPRTKQRMASITIKREGVQNFQLPIVAEGSHGFLCRTGTGPDAIATEWFAKNSDKVTAREIV